VTLYFTRSLTGGLFFRGFDVFLSRIIISTFLTRTTSARGHQPTELTPRREYSQLLPSDLLFTLKRITRSPVFVSHQSHEQTQNFATMFLGLHRYETLASTYLMSEDAERDSLDARDYWSTNKKSARLAPLITIARENFFIAVALLFCVVDLYLQCFYANGDRIRPQHFVTTSRRIACAFFTALSAKFSFISLQKKIQFSDKHPLYVTH
jgi:hypothetical protein